jgi:GAF domain
MCPTPDSTLADPYQINADLQRQLAECRAERDEALARETAMAEVLQVINSSAGDLASVFDAMLEKARRLCEADVGTFWTFEGERFYPTVVSGPFNREARAMQAGWRPGPNVSLERVMAGENVVHVVDVAADAGYQSDVETRARTTAAGARSILTVALRKDDRLLGAITTGLGAIFPQQQRHCAIFSRRLAISSIATCQSKSCDPQMAGRWWRVRLR